MDKEEFVNRDVPRDSLRMYNDFCASIREGDILYNIDNTNMWGSYLLVAARASINMGGHKTWFMLLIGLDKDGEEFTSNNTRINLNPDKASSTSYLKRIGHTKFKVDIVFKEVNINNGLAVVYENTDLWKYSRKLDTRKPRKKKYDRTGDLLIKNYNND